VLVLNDLPVAEDRDGAWRLLLRRGGESIPLADDLGYGVVIGDGAVEPGQENAARAGAANCPERAITLLERA
jgi:hypothetical protein